MRHPMPRTPAGPPRTLARLRATLLVALGAALLPSAQALDLMGAYRLALERDATVRASRASLDAAREKLPQARALLMPSLGLSIGRYHNDTSRRALSSAAPRLDEDYISQNQALQLRQALYRPALVVGLAQARAQADTAESALLAELQSLQTRVAQAYLQVLLAREERQLAQMLEQVGQVQLDAARKGWMAGAGTRTDVDEVQARLDLWSAQSLEAQNQLQLAWRDLETLVDQPIDGLDEADEDNWQPITADPADLAAWLRRTEQHSPTLRGLRSRIEQARLDIERAQAGHLPTLDAVLQLTRSRSENPLSPGFEVSNQQIGLQLVVPLYAGGGIDAQVREAMAAHVSSQAQYDAARREVELDVRRAYQGAEEGALKVRAMEQAVRSASQAVVSNRLSFEAGSRTVIEILDAERALYEALRDLTRERFKQALAVVRLESLAGDDSLRALGLIQHLLRPPVTY